MTAHIVAAYAPTIAPDRPEWTAAAVCQHADPDIFYPKKGGSTAEAKRVCRGCPVRAECLAYALQHDELSFGVWGGLSVVERRRLKPRPGRRRGPKPKPIEHGTENGYYAHRRRGEPVCRDCREACTAEHRRRLQQRRSA